MNPLLRFQTFVHGNVNREDFLKAVSTAIWLQGQIERKAFYHRAACLDMYPNPFDAPPQNLNERFWRLFCSADGTSLNQAIKNTERIGFYIKAFNANRIVMTITFYQKGKKKSPLLEMSVYVDKYGDLADYTLKSY